MGATLRAMRPYPVDLCYRFRIKISTLWLDAADF